MRKNIRKKSPKTETSIPLSQPKFKPLKLPYNQLQSKYDIFKNGSPNNYHQDLQALKVFPIKNQFNVLEMPAIDYLLRDIKNTEKDVGANQRNYNIHPSMTQKYASKFKNFVSDKQEIKDFIEWFNSKEKEIDVKDCSLNKKFHLKQTLIAAGFHQILIQICNISRPRSQILKMLWNKQNDQAGKVISILHKQNSEKQKNNLQTIKCLHLDYQQQILNLKNQSYCIEKKLEQASILNEGCINTLRSMKKEKKKLERVIKQLSQANLSLKNESFTLLQENTKLLMKEKGLSQQHARILSYRMIYLQKMRKQGEKKVSVKDIFKQIKNKADNCVENNDLIDLDEKKEKLVDFIKKRIHDNPQEKRYILRGEFSDEEDQNIELQQKIEEFFNGKEIRSQIQSQYNPNKFYVEKGVGTENDKKIKQQIEEGIQTQQVMISKMKTSKGHFNSQFSNIGDLFALKEDEDQIQMIKLKQKKARTRHSLLMIEMNRTMEIKKLDSASKVRRVSRFSNVCQPPSHQRNISGFSSKQNNRRSRVDSEEEEKSNYRNSDEKQQSRQEIETIKKIRQSTFNRKSIQFENMVKVLTSNFHSDEVTQQESSFASEQAPPKVLQKIDKLEQFREIARKYLQNQNGKNKAGNNVNPQKILKKILTDTYKNIYVSNRSNFLAEMINSAKNCYGNLTYQNRMLQHISTIMGFKQSKSLLAAISILLNIPSTEIQYGPIISDDVNELYFRTYFTLTLKNPVETQFNIWNNYTNLNKISSKAFHQLLLEFFNENKCQYLHLKLKQFIGIDSHESLQGNYYVEINSLMMYILQVYVLEKKNYYDSYSSLINFLAEDDEIDLDSFVFLMDLLCFDEGDQKKIISNVFKYDGNKKQQKKSDKGFCKKDQFYRLCIKYELPLFELIRILKFEQYKKLHEHIQSQFVDINAVEKWDEVKLSLQSKLRSRAKFTPSFSKIMSRLDHYVKGKQFQNNDIFSFLYRIVVHSAFF